MLTAVNLHFRYYGGKTNLLAEDSISTWQPTVLKNPWLYGGGLVEISGMIEDDTKRLSMQKAVQVKPKMSRASICITLITPICITVIYDKRIFNSALN